MIPFGVDGAMGEGDVEVVGIGNRNLVFSEVRVLVLVSFI